MKKTPLSLLCAFVTSFALLAASLTACAQDSVIRHVAPTFSTPIFPAYFIDSQQVLHFERIYLDVNNINKIQVVKGTKASDTYDSLHHTQGQIYIDLKKPFRNFFTLAIIARQQSNMHSLTPPGEKFLYIIDNIVIRDTTGVRLDPGYIERVDGVELKDINSVGKSAQVMVITIKTKARPPQPEPPGTIHIRGAGK